jgi:glycosyltransferase involved in cell wall biosynthesis
VTGSGLKRLGWNLLITLALPLLFLAAALPTRKRTLLVWGSDPLLSNKYWSRAMQAAGFESETIMEGNFPILQKDDFDSYFKEMAPLWLPHLARMGIGTVHALIHVLRHGRVLHTSFQGFALNRTIYWQLEPLLLRLAGVRTIVIPFGADAYLYSKTIDPSLRYGLLASYPDLARGEDAIQCRVRYWVRRADAVVAGLMVDGIGRWDVTTNCPFCIDIAQWTGKAHYGRGDGSSGAVRILHTPNHRGFKGTEFLIDAVERLRAEGLDLELVTLEKVKNSEVKTTMQSVDILAEQFIATGYAFSGIEGMASGLPVLANLDHEAYTRVFRRYGFLDECPILSSPPERLADNLRLLIRNPALREELGRAGRAYVEKYHSYAAAQYMFGSIYRKFDGEEVDLINLFHPLKSAYNRATPKIAHPLIDSRLPASDPRWSC